LSHRYILERVEKTPDFPMSVDQVRRILEGPKRAR
jgi:hypothetical protein